jgi:Fuc2NAc and GlcNAc transferase
MLWIAFFSALIFSCVLTGLVRRYALAAQLIDYPNARSSHTAPKPRGGGLAIVIVGAVGVSTLVAARIMELRLAMGLIGGGAIVALVGFLDDRRSLPVRFRMLAHFAAAGIAMYALGGLPPIRLGEVVVDAGAAGYVLGAVGIVWTLNLFNFMDGIDGIAASEAIFVAGAGSVLALLAGDAAGVASAGLLFTAACLGFLLWNWPPARIFMGDVGSGFVGYFIAVLAVGVARENSVALLVWLILGGVFFVDATVTFIRRLLQGERFYEAHRSHAYQWLARRWSSHKRVTLLVLLVNFVWLLPCACVAMMYPTGAAWLVLVALAPLAVLTVLAGAGRRETGTH